jgi:hypothetical protein
MDKEVQLNHPLPDDVVDAARTLYAGPDNDAYWASLQSRVMSKVADNAIGRMEGRREWWQVVNGWSRVGLAAAAAILIAMGALLMRTHSQEIQSAYDTRTKPTPTESLVPAGALGEREGSDSRDASFRDVIMR